MRTGAQLEAHSTRPEQRLAQVPSEGQTVRDQYRGAPPITEQGQVVFRNFPTAPRICRALCQTRGSLRRGGKEAEVVGSCTPMTLLVGCMAMKGESAP